MVDGDPRDQSLNPLSFGPTLQFTIFAIIILSCIELATEGPRVEPDSVEAMVQYYRCV